MKKDVAKEFGFVIQVTKTDTGFEVFLRDGRYFYADEIALKALEGKMPEIDGVLDDVPIRWWGELWDLREDTETHGQITFLEIVSSDEIAKSKVGVRFNEGKPRLGEIHPHFEAMIGDIITEHPGLRLDLIPKSMFVELGKVYTEGAKKYSDRNWEKGLSWVQTLNSMKRHLNKFMRGQSVDKELGVKVLAQVMWGCAALLEFEGTHPELDDRPESWLDLKEEVK